MRSLFSIGGLSAGLLSTVLLVSACQTRDGARIKEDGTTTPGGTTGADPAALAAGAKAVLEMRCASCHSPANAQGAVNYITDLQKLIDKKKVKRGTEDDRKKSKILTRVFDADSPMPPLVDDQNNNAPIERLSQEDIKALQDWVMADSPIPAPATNPTGMTNPPPTPAPPTPTADAAADPAALAAAAKAALTKACSSCHNAANAQGAINYIADLAKLIDKKKVKRGAADRAKSRVLVRILDAESPMPPLVDDQNNNAPVPKLEPADLKAIQDWIMADAPVPAP